VILFAGRLTRMTSRQAAIGALRALHYAILAWGVVGWAIPSIPWLVAYLILMTLIAVQWMINRNTCILNNLESWIATGRWRDETDANQGGFIAGVVQMATGRRPSDRAANILSYGLLAVFWALGFAHLGLYIVGGPGT
jgi:hypothetical protein